MFQIKKISARLGLIGALLAVLLLMMIGNSHPATASTKPMQGGKVALATEESDGLDFGADDSSDDSNTDANTDEEPTATKSKKRATATPEDEDKVPDIEDIDLTDDPNDVVDALRENDYLTTKRDGKLLFTFPPNGATFGKTKAEGYGYVSLGRGKTSENFVLFSTVEWTEAGKDSMCGVGFRETNTNGAYVMLSNNGLIWASVLEDNDTTDEIELHDDNQDYFNPEEVNNILVIADDDVPMIFINGKYIGKLKAPVQDGVFRIWLWNAKGNKKVTHCVFNTGWVWSFDS